MGERKTCYQNAQEILSLLQLICSQRETDNPVGSTNTPVQDVSAADEIRKFKALMEEGIIRQLQPCGLYTAVAQ